MDTMRWAFYRPYGGMKDLWGNTIGFYTGTINSVCGFLKGKGWKFRNYCHVEIGMKVADVRAVLNRRSDLNKGKLVLTIFGLSDDAYIYYSSASRNPDGTNGTRWGTEETLFKNHDRWDVYEVTSLRSTEAMVETCQAEVDKPYDYTGLASFLTLFGLINEKLKWYCSEICYHIFSGKWVRRISPFAAFLEIELRIIKEILV